MRNLKIAAEQATCTTDVSVAAHNPDPVRFLDGEWGFYEEDWATWHGGHACEASARQALSVYCREVLGA